MSKSVWPTNGRVGAPPPEELAFSKAGTEHSGLSILLADGISKNAARETSALNFAKRARSEGTLAPIGPSSEASVSVTQKVINAEFWSEIFPAHLLRATRTARPVHAEGSSRNP